MGAWIEIYDYLATFSLSSSLPTWERGLKWTAIVNIPSTIIVAPYMGAWIEMCLT